VYEGGDPPVGAVYNPRRRQSLVVVERRREPLLFAVVAVIVVVVVLRCAVSKHHKLVDTENRTIVPGTFLSFF
jgi:hypothetical protein